MVQRGLIAAAMLLSAAALHASAEELGIGDAAPGLEVQEFVKGEPVKKFEKGKVYVVEFWATWCGPCKATIHHLTELQKKYKDIAFIGVSVAEKDQDAVKPFVEKMGDKMDYRVAMDSIAKDKKSSDGAMLKNWMMASGQRGIPCAFIVNGDGKIVWLGDPSEMDKPLEKIHDGKWDLKAAKEEYVEAKKEQARRMAEAAKARKEKLEHLIEKLPEVEKTAVKAVQEWGGALVPDSEGKTIAAVDLRGKPVTDANLKELKRLKGLHELILNDTKVTDDGLKELNELKELRVLSLAGTAVTDTGLKELKGLEGLERLSLQKTQVTDAGLKELKDLKNLRLLVLMKTKVTQEGYEDLQKTLPELKIIP